MRLLHHFSYFLVIVAVFSIPINKDSSTPRVAAAFTAHTSAKETVTRGSGMQLQSGKAGKSSLPACPRRNERENDLMEKTNAWNHV